MNILHSGKTEAQLMVIKNTIGAMIGIDDGQFDMGRELEKIDRCDEIDECNTVGCMATWCVVVTRGIENSFQCGHDLPCDDAAKLMGLRRDEAQELFTPNNDTANFNCGIKTAPQYVSRQRAILALSFYYWHDEIEWDITKLNQHAFDKKIGVLIILGQ